jgi:hypothetical protein
MEQNGEAVLPRVAVLLPQVLLQIEVAVVLITVEVLRLLLVAVIIQVAVLVVLILHLHLLLPEVIHRVAVAHGLPEVVILPAAVVLHAVVVVAVEVVAVEDNLIFNLKEDYDEKDKTDNGCHCLFSCWEQYAECAGDNI